MGIGGFSFMNSSGNKTKLKDLSLNNYEALAQTTFVIYQCATNTVPGDPSKPIPDLIRDCETCKPTLSGYANSWGRCNNNGPL